MMAKQQAAKGTVEPGDRIEMEMFADGRWRVKVLRPDCGATEFMTSSATGAIYTAIEWLGTE